MTAFSLEFPQNPPVPHFLLKDVLSKLAYVDEGVKSAKISSSGDLITLELRSSAPADLWPKLADRVGTLVKAMAENAFEPEFRILEQHSHPAANQIDPMAELLARREVVKEGPGYFVLGPLLTGLVTCVERRILEVADEMGASQYRFPALISANYMEKVQYFRNFPHSLTFATHLRENLPDIQRFSCDAVTEDGRILVDQKLYAPVPAMLAPTVCHHLYLTMSGCKIEGDGVTATANGNCFRFESNNMVSLERVWNFTMREIIFVGTEQYIAQHLEEVRNRIRPLLDELGLTYTVMTANDPFFIGTFRDQAAYQAAFELKYEIRALLPFKGDTIAVGSYNRHGDFFGRALNIQAADGTPAHTGCVGIGFERLAYAFVCQHGLDPKKWPARVREAIGVPEDSRPRFTPLH
jgi:seryl-tRNA synthetase